MNPAGTPFGASVGSWLRLPIALDLEVAKFPDTIASFKVGARALVPPEELFASSAAPAAIFEIPKDIGGRPPGKLGAVFLRLSKPNLAWGACFG